MASLTHYVRVSLDPEHSIDVATVPVVVILKMAAWLDRPAERDRDLHDLAHLFNEYLEPNAPRRWSDEFVKARLDSISVCASFGHENPTTISTPDFASFVVTARKRLVTAFPRYCHRRAMVSLTRSVLCARGRACLRRSCSVVHLAAVALPSAGRLDSRYVGRVYVL